MYNVSDDIRNTILELCFEDDWGSWELWWSISSKTLSGDVPKTKELFIEIISELVASGVIVSKKHELGGVCVPVAFDVSRLIQEIEHSDRPNDNCYWFGYR